MYLISKYIYGLKQKILNTIQLIKLLTYLELN